MAKKLNAETFRTTKDGIFALIRNKENKIVICLGGYLASKKTFDSFKQAELYIESKPYELLINICGIILYKQNENTKKETAESAKSTEAN